MQTYIMFDGTTVVRKSDHLDGMQALRDVFASDIKAVARHDRAIELLGDLVVAFTQAVDGYEDCDEIVEAQAIIAEAKEADNE